MDLTRRTLLKVPEITAIFWITKLVTTAMGESTSDYLVRRMNPVLAVGLGGILLLVALVLQFRAARYVPRIYWFAVLVVAITGTMAADVLHKQFGVPYAASTPLFAIVLVIVFVAWDRTEGTLSIHSVDTPRREIFYWAAVMATFAMGTALGDLTANTLKLGYLASAVLFAGLMLIPAIGFRWMHMNGIFAFWFAYVLTRPLGASVADWLGKGHEVGGLALGDGVVSLFFAVALVACVMVMTARQGPTEPAPRGAVVPGLPDG
jgi:uncharacterized membrane-anchored protein